MTHSYTCPDSFIHLPSLHTQTLVSLASGQRDVRKTCARDRGNSQAFREQRRDEAEDERRRKEEDLLDALLGPAAAKSDDAAAGGSEGGVGEGVYEEEEGEWDSLDADEEARAEEDEEARAEEEVEDALRVQRERILRRYEKGGILGGAVGGRGASGAAAGGGGVAVGGTTVKDLNDVQLLDVDREEEEKENASEHARVERLDDSLVAYARQVGGLDSLSAPVADIGEGAPSHSKSPAAEAAHARAHTHAHLLPTSLSDPDARTRMPLSRGVVESISGARRGGNAAGHGALRVADVVEQGGERGGVGRDFLSEVDRILGRKDSLPVYDGVRDRGGERERQGQREREVEEMEPFMPHHFLRSTYMLGSHPSPSALGGATQLGASAVTAAADAATRAVAAASKAVANLRDPALPTYTHNRAATTTTPVSLGGRSGSGGVDGGGGGRGDVVFMGGRVGGQMDVKVGAAALGGGIPYIATHTPQHPPAPPSQLLQEQDAGGGSDSDADSLDQRWVGGWVGGWVGVCARVRACVHVYMLMMYVCSQATRMLIPWMRTVCRRVCADVRVQTCVCRRACD